VVFPQRNTRADQRWFGARNKCLLDGGDLADEAAKDLALPRSDKDKYLIGLRRNEFMWLASGKTIVTR